MLAEIEYICETENVAIAMLPKMKWFNFCGQTKMKKKTWLLVVGGRVYNAFVILFSIGNFFNNICFLRSPTNEDRSTISIPENGYINNWKLFQPKIKTTIWFALQLED